MRCVPLKSPRRNLPVPVQLASGLLLFTRAAGKGVAIAAHAGVGTGAGEAHAERSPSQRTRSRLHETGEVVSLDLRLADPEISQDALGRIHHRRRPGDVKGALAIIRRRFHDHLLADSAPAPWPVLGDGGRIR